MERLTYRLNDQFDNPTDSIILKPYLRYEAPETRKKILNRLAAYEDTGLEPEDLKKAFNETAILKLAAQALSTTPDHLRDLIKAEQGGRLVVLPCKVGDDVWLVRKFGKERCIKRAEVSCINIDCRGEVFVSARRISGGYIGKTVFLTREEAEAALKGGESDA